MPALLGPADAPLQISRGPYPGETIIPDPTPTCYFVRSNNVHARLQWAATAFCDVRGALQAALALGRDADVRTLTRLRHALACLVVGRHPPPATPPRSPADPRHLHRVALEVQYLLNIPGLSIQHATCGELRRQTIRAASLRGIPAVDRADALSASSAHRYSEDSDGGRSYDDEEWADSAYGDEGEASFEEDNFSSTRDRSQPSVRQDDDPWGLDELFHRAQR